MLNSSCSCSAMCVHFWSFDFHHLQIFGQIQSCHWFFCVTSITLPHLNTICVMYREVITTHNIQNRMYFSLSWSKTVHTYVVELATYSDYDGNHVKLDTKWAPENTKSADQNSKSSLDDLSMKWQMVIEWILINFQISTLVWRQFLLCASVRLVKHNVGPWGQFSLLNSTRQRRHIVRCGIMRWRATFHGNV